MKQDQNNFQYNIKNREDKVHRRVKIFNLHNKLRRNKIIIIMKIIILIKMNIINSYMVRIRMNNY